MASKSEPGKTWLRHRDDRRAIGFAVMHLALVAGTLGWFRAGAPLWVFAAIALPLIASSSFIQLISVHNAMHSPILWSRTHNRIWQCVLSLCIGYPVSIYVPVHNLSHHLGLQTPRDVGPPRSGIARTRST